MRTTSAWRSSPRWLRLGRIRNARRRRADPRAGHRPGRLGALGAGRHRHHSPRGVTVTNLARAPRTSCTRRRPRVLGRAAHCSATRPTTPTAAPTRRCRWHRSALQGSDVVGTLAYNSWLPCRRARDGRGRVRAQRPRADPAAGFPQCTGEPVDAVLRRPVGINTAGTSSGDQVLS